MKKTPLFLFQAILLFGVFYFLGKQIRQFFSPADMINSSVAKIETMPAHNYSFAEVQKKYNEPILQQTHKLKDLHEISKIKLLQGMYSKESKENFPYDIDKINFYLSILNNKNEPWFIKRQAMKNMASYWVYLNEQERSDILKNVDVRARATWRETSADIAHKIMGSYEP